MNARLWVQTVINLLLIKLEEKNMKKLNKKKGFTLAELLVVVAIIAVLVAISIPIFTSQLNKAKKATNQANLRAAKGAAVSQYLSDGNTGKATYVYDIANGTITTITSEEAKDSSTVTIDSALDSALYSSISVSVNGTEVTLFATAK
jgi:type IV pilus assembly protein PilA